MQIFRRHWRSFSLLLGAAVVLCGQTSRVPIDNDQIRVVMATVQPHQPTRLHEHKVNRVMVYLQPGREDLRFQDGHTTVLNWKAGEVKWSPAAGPHVAEVMTDQPVTIAEIELKKPGNAARQAGGALDPVKVDPKHYKVEFENDQVRVIRVHIGPGEKTPMHEHLLPRVLVHLTDQKIRVTPESGAPTIAEHHAGEVSEGKAAKHSEENINGTPFEAVVVELKG